MSTTTAQTDKATTATEDDATPEKSLDDDIRDLESKAAAEEGNTKTANRANNALLAAAAIVGVLIALTSLWVSRANSRLRVIENLLNSLRMAKVKADAQTEATRIETEAQKREAQIKADAEVKIAQAHAVGEQASERAGEANKRAEEIAGENIKLGGELDRATAEARRDAEALRRQNLTTEARLEEERRTRLELEETLAPRFIPLSELGDEQNIDPLKLFAGVNVVIECLPDAEPRRLATNLAGLLNAAGWKISAINVRDNVSDGLQEGVRIDAAPFWQSDAGTRAAEALRAFLTVNNIHSGMAPPFRRRRQPEAFPIDTVIIHIALKPDPYFRDKAGRESFERLGGDSLKDFDEFRARAKKEQKESAERLLNELRQAWRARRAQPKKD